MSDYPSNPPPTYSASPSKPYPQHDHANAFQTRPDIREQYYQDTRTTSSPNARGLSTTSNAYAWAQSRQDSIVTSKPQPQDFLAHEQHDQDFSDASSELDPREAAYLTSCIPSTLPPPTCAPRLSRVVAIPQIGIKSMISTPPPVTRANPPSLTSIPKAEFLSILDTLNICITPWPPFQVVKAASTVIGCVPHHWALGVSAGLGVLAVAGTAATCHVRTKRWLQEVSKKTGLEWQLVKDEVLLGKIGVTEEAVWNSMSKDIEGKDPVEKRFKVLSPHLASLDFDVSPPAEQKNVMNKMSAKQNQRKLNKKSKDAAKKEREKEENLRKAALKYGRQRHEVEDLWESDTKNILSLEDEIEKLNRKVGEINRKADDMLVEASEKKARDIEKKRMEKLKDIEKTRMELEDALEKCYRKGNQKVVSKEEKERKKMGKLMWLVISNVGTT